MTIIIAVRHKNTIILAADGQATSSKDYIENNNCVKIETAGRYTFAGAGACSSSPIMKQLLAHIDEVGEDHPLDLYLSGMSTGIKEDDEDNEGSFILIKQDEDRFVTDFLYVVLGHKVSVQNMLAENQDLMSIGCGSPIFQGAFGALNKDTLKDTKLSVMTSMKVVAQLSPFCNDVIDMRTYKLRTT